MTTLKRHRFPIAFAALVALGMVAIGTLSPQSAVSQVAVLDQIWVTTTTTGTGTLTQSGTVTGYRAPTAADTGKTFRIVIEAVDANGIRTGQEETCTSVYTHSGTTWTRGTLHGSSTGSRIDFAAGTKRISVISAAIDLAKIPSHIDVASAATAGLGTSASPWTGWDTAITWTANTEYYFRAGYFAYATSPNFLLTGIVLKGDGDGTILKHTGTGNAFEMDEPDAGEHIWRPRVENLTLMGNANTTNGFFLRGIIGGQFNNLRFTGGCTNACLWTEACVLNELNSFFAADLVWTTAPPYGFVLTDRGDTGSGDQTTTWSVNNLGIARTTNTCLWLKNTFYNTFYNCAPGFSSGKGVVTSSAATQNVFIQVDCESNTGKDWQMDGNANTLITCFGTSSSADNCHFNNIRTTIVGGIFTNATFVSGNQATVTGATFTGTLTDSSEFSQFFNCINSSTGLYVSGKRQQAGPTFVRVAFQSGSYTMDVNLYGELHYDFPQGAFTIANPTVTPKDGQEFTVRINWAAVSSVVSWGDKFRGPGATIPAGTNVNGKTDYYHWKYHLADDKYDLINVSQNH